MLTPHSLPLRRCYVDAQQSLFTAILAFTGKGSRFIDKRILRIKLIIFVSHKIFLSPSDIDPSRVTRIYTMAG